MLCTFLRCRLRLQFWFLLGLKARLQTGHNNSCVVVGAGVVDKDDDEEEDTKEVIEAEASDIEPKRSESTEGDDSRENEDPAWDIGGEPDMESAKSLRSSSAGDMARWSKADRDGSHSSSLGVIIGMPVWYPKEGLRVVFVANRGWK
ncbi:hypothetical protein BGZ54_002068 [Gamsiella multidivaricata]|nr:hypothetical protein BGZ54_002068 [Gamsiella multidivaricata]